MIKVNNSQRGSGGGGRGPCAPCKNHLAAGYVPPRAVEVLKDVGLVPRDPCAHEAQAQEEEHVRGSAAHEQILTRAPEPEAARVSLVSANKQTRR